MRYAQVGFEPTTHCTPDIHVDEHFFAALPNNNYYHFTL